MQEQWTHWEPIAGLARKYYIEFSANSIEGFKIILSEQFNEKNKVHILFKKYVISYQITNSSFRFKTMDAVADVYGADFYGDWTFFKINNSNYVKWVSEESYDWTGPREFRHFVFIAIDLVLEVIADYEPEVTMVHLP